MTNLTDEHVFMAAIGGKLVVKGSCVQCNNALNKEFEEKMTRRLAHFRRVVRTPDREGNLPVLETKLVESDGKELDGRLMPDGNVQLKPKFTEVVKNGVQEIVGEHLTEKQREQMRQKAKEEGWEVIEGTSPGGEVQGSFSGELDFIDSPEMLRVVAKTAYTALALHCGSNFAMSDTFNNLRTYVRTGSGTPSAKLFLNEGYLAECAQGPHQHSVILVGRKDKHSVDAIVRLFGGLCYFVKLSERYEGADFYSTLVYDAQRGEVNQTLVVDVQSEFLQIDEVRDSKGTVWNDRVTAGEWFIKFLAEAMNTKQNK